MTPPQLRRPPAPQTLRWVEQCLGTGSKITVVQPLAGGTAHANHALTVVSRSGSVHRLVLRRWLRPDPEFSPEREIAALALLASCSVPTPALVAADPSGVYCDAPTLLVSRLPGGHARPTRDELPEYLMQLAAAAVIVHDVGGGAGTLPPYRPHNPLVDPAPPVHARRPRLWQQAFEVAAGRTSAGDTGFIHRDYQPANTLWAYGRLTGVVDWSTASAGPVAVDVAEMRVRLMFDHGPRAADDFLHTFSALRGDYTHDPYWDVRAVVDLLPEDPARPLPPADVAALEDYLVGLLADLGDGCAAD